MSPAGTLLEALLGLAGVCVAIWLVLLLFVNAVKRSVQEETVVYLEPSPKNPNGLIKKPGETYLSTLPHHVIVLRPVTESVGPHNLTYKPDENRLRRFLAADPIAKLRQLHATNPRLNFEDYAGELGIEILRVDPPQAGTPTGSRKAALDVSEQIIADTRNLADRFIAIGGAIEEFERRFQTEVLEKYADTFNANPDLLARILALKDDAILRLLEKMSR